MHPFIHVYNHTPQDMRDGWSGRPVSPAHQSALVAHWAFDEGEGYLVHDRSGHGNDLWALYNPTWQVMLIITGCC